MRIKRYQKTNGKLIRISGALLSAALLAAAFPAVMNSQEFLEDECFLEEEEDYFADPAGEEEDWEEDSLVSDGEEELFQDELAAPIMDWLAEEPENPEYPGGLEQTESLEEGSTEAAEYLFAEAEKDAIRGECGLEPETVYWELDEEGTLYIQGAGAMLDWEKAEEVPWYAYSEQITSVEIQEGVTTIGSYAFSSCSKLKSIIFG